MPRWLYFPYEPVYVSGLFFDDTYTFDGVEYASVAGSIHSLVVEHDSSGFPLRKMWVRSQAAGNADVYPWSIIQDSTGRIFASFIVGRNGASGGTYTVDIGNADGYVGTTLVMSDIDGGTNSFGFVVAWDANGDVLWASRAALHVTGSGTNPFNSVSALALSADEATLYLILRFGIVPTNNPHTWDMLPDTNGSSFTASLTHQADLVTGQLEVNPTTGVISAAQYASSVSTLAGSVYLGMYTAYGYAGEIALTGDGYVPVQGYSFGFTSSRQPVSHFNPTPVTGNLRVFAPTNPGSIATCVCALAYSSGVWRYAITLNTGAISTHTYGHGTDAKCFGLSDNSVLWFASSRDTSFSDRGWWKERDTATSGAESMVRVDLAHGRGASSPGAYSTILVRLADNLVTPADPTVSWSMTYGPSPTAIKTSGTADNNAFVAAKLDEPGGVIYAVFKSLSQEFWTGSAYIDTVPNWGLVGAGSLTILCLDITDGTCLWWQLIQSQTGALADKGAAPFIVKDIVHVPVYFDDNALFDDGGLGELLVTATGDRVSGFAKYNKFTGEFLGFDEIFRSASVDVRVVAATSKRTL